MDLAIALVLIVFMGLFMGGGYLLIRGLLKGIRKQAIWGVVLLVVCGVFVWLMKFVPGMY